METKTKEKIFVKGLIIEAIGIYREGDLIVRSASDGYLVCESDNHNYVILDAKMKSYWKVMNIEEVQEEILELSWGCFKPKLKINCVPNKPRYKIREQYEGGWLGVSASEGKEITHLIHPDLSCETLRGQSEGGMDSKDNGSCWEIIERPE